MDSPQIALRHAYPHQWGDGKVHRIDPGDPTKLYCGRSLKDVPGDNVVDYEHRITCQNCILKKTREAERRERKLQWERERQERERQWQQEREAREAREAREHLRAQYIVAAIPTWYQGVLFRSRLEARWAAFADLARWLWKYEPIDLNGWIPDFEFSFPCWSPACPEQHVLYAEVKPYRTIDEFASHAVSKIDQLAIPSPAKFGYHPSVTQWTMLHEELPFQCHADEWIINNAGYNSENAAGNPAWDAYIEMLWNKAGNLTRWNPHAART